VTQERENRDENADVLEELEGPAQEMEGAAKASKESLAKEQPPAEHEVGERPER
jgi:hypothetical protein